MAEVAPKNGEFFEGKFWFERKGSLLTLGLTQLALEDVGVIRRVEFPADGDDFEKGEIVVTVEGSAGKLDLITPAAGIVQEINEAAQQEPEIVTEDPCEEGWLIRLEIQDTSDLKEYRDA